MVIEDGITMGGKPLKDHLEAIGHSKAYDHIYELTKNAQIQEVDILKLHRLFYSPIDTENAGKYREVQVYILGTEFLPPSPTEVPTLMKKFVSAIPTKQSRMHPVDFA